MNLWGIPWSCWSVLFPVPPLPWRKKQNKAEDYNKDPSEMPQRRWWGVRIPWTCWKVAKNLKESWWDIDIEDIRESFQNCSGKLKNGTRVGGRLFLAVESGTLRAATYWRLDCDGWCVLFFLGRVVSLLVIYLVCSVFYLFAIHFLLAVFFWVGANILHLAALRLKDATSQSIYAECLPIG